MFFGSFCCVGIQMKGVVWRYGLSAYLRFLIIFSVFCNCKALEHENGELVDQNLNCSNKSLSLSDELDCCNRSDVSEKSSKTNHVGVMSISRLQRKDGQEQSGLAPDYIFANRRIPTPKNHSWIGELVPKVTIIIVVITVVAVAICCIVHVKRPDLFKSQRFKEDESIGPHKNGNISL